MLIAQISDSHIARRSRRAYGVASTAENLARCVEHINHLVPSPDLVLVTGDITYSGLQEEAEHAASLLEKLRYPYYIVPGNHDSRSTLWSVFAEHACPCTDKDFINYVIEGYDIRLIGMDSSISGSPGGEMCEKRLRWLERQLSKTRKKPTIIFMHHPPAKFGVLETDEDGFIGADRLGNIIVKHHNIEAILCGHIHLAAHRRWCGTVISTAPSMGLQLVLDLTLKQSSKFTLTPPGYQLHYCTAEMDIVTHTISVKDTDRQYLFEECREEQ